MTAALTTARPLCDGWAAKDTRIRVIHRSNGGLSAARNSGLDICTGEYIAFVDSDDRLEPETLKRALHASKGPVQISPFSTTSALMKTTNSCRTTSGGLREEKR